MQFTKATRKKARLRLALTGPSGSGKTMAALMIAKGLGGRVALLDTEHGSASLYAEPMVLPNGTRFDPPEFDALDLSAPYSPERYIEAIHAAEKAGYDTLIIDSLTHEWSGSGGCLEINDTVAAAKFRGNSWSAWNETTPRHRAFVDAMLQSRMHIIGTGRSKTETAQTEGENGRKQVVKLGMKTEQRDGIEYEFTVVLDLIHAGHYANASKDRTGLFAGGEPAPISVATGERLLAWLESGAEPAPPAQPETKGKDMSPKARAGRIEDGVKAGDATGAAAYLATLPSEEADSIWAHIAPAIQDQLTAVWPEVTA